MGQAAQAGGALSGMGTSGLGSKYYTVSTEEGNASEHDNGVWAMKNVVWLGASVSLPIS